jgi:3D (Asp-Asp-Asp) domain-containing protein
MKMIIGLFVVLQMATAVQAQNHNGSSKCGFSKVAASASFPKTYSDSLDPNIPTRLARVTAYWPGEDYYTNHKMTATGARLRPGYCAVDSNIIPYGSTVIIPGVGNFLAMDTGTAVISRKAARESGHNRAERSALVVDLYFPSRRAGELFSRVGPKFVMVAWGSAPVRVASD